VARGFDPQKGQTSALDRFDGRLGSARLSFPRVFARALTAGAAGAAVNAGTAGAIGTSDFAGAAVTAGATATFGAAANPAGAANPGGAGAIGTTDFAGAAFTAGATATFGAAANPGGAVNLGSAATALSGRLVDSARPMVAASPLPNEPFTGACPLAAAPPVACKAINCGQGKENEVIPKNSKSGRQTETVSNLADENVRFGYVLLLQCTDFVQHICCFCISGIGPLRPPVRIGTQSLEALQ